MRFDGNVLRDETGAELGSIWINRRRWHWRAGSAQLSLSDQLGRLPTDRD